MCDPVSIGLAAVSAVGSYVQSSKQAKATDSASRQAAENAKDAKTQRERDFNAANKKKPDLGALLAANKGGGGSTSLTGATGVSQADLTLGKPTLLGG